MRQTGNLRILTLAMAAVLGAATVAACNSSKPAGGSGGVPDAGLPDGGDGLPDGGTGPDGGVTTTVIPTAPAGLPALTAASPGFTGHVADGLGLTVPNAPVPAVTGSTILDKDAAIRLGKALFWDAQTGSDGKMACASCHFHAGADNRTRNTVHPGTNTSFEMVGITGAGQTYAYVSFDASVVNDRVGSSGVASQHFSSIPTDLDNAVDFCADATPLTGSGATDDQEAVMFSAGERLVTGRNTPPVLNAVFNDDNFWDGRAKNGFNGFSPIGANDGDHPTTLTTNSSLASQSVGPPLSNVEMSCAGRAWNGPNSLGAKLVVRTPLKNQLVDPNDSVLGALSNSPSSGLKCGFTDRLCTYADLIAAAFGTGGLSGQAAVDAYIANFSTIWGQAVQAYEATLVSDQTPYDKFIRGNATALTTAQQEGLAEFRNACAVCHVEPELTDASVRFVAANGPTNADGADQGFHNIGVSPTAEDLGRGSSPGPHGSQAANAGAFKTPSLRNVKLTAPYMHNGRFATLANVVEFYDDANAPMNIIENPQLSKDIPAKVGGGAKADVVDFLMTGLTDCRVEHDVAPFDHPALDLPNGPSLPARGQAGDGTVCPP